MAIEMELDEDFNERRLHRLDLWYRSAQTAVAEARAQYASVSEVPGATDLQRHQALLRLQRTTRQMLDIQRAIELLQDGGSDRRAI